MAKGKSQESRVKSQDDTTEHVSVVYTGKGKGKTSASLGLLLRALGADKRVAFVQFIKHWEVSEHKTIRKLEEVYEGQLIMIKGGLGFYDAGNMSAKNVTDEEHKQAARSTYDEAMQFIKSGNYDLVICDEINNAVADGLLDQSDLWKIIDSAKGKVSLCLTGRNFPEDLIKDVDIVTEMKKLRHHYDDGVLATKGIDY